MANKILNMDELAQSISECIDAAHNAIKLEDDFDVFLEDAVRFAWLLTNATLTTTLRQGVKVWSLEVVGDYPHDAGMGDVPDMIDLLRPA